MPPYRLSDLPVGQTDWEGLATADATPDAENPEWTKAALRSADLITPGSLPRSPLYIRVYTEVLDYYKSFGKGYQTRLNNDLLALVRKKRATGESRIRAVHKRRVEINVGHRHWEGRPPKVTAG
jgi:uncharacterized protein (DUF4415 family)